VDVRRGRDRETDVVLAELDGDSSILKVVDQVEGGRAIRAGNSSISMP
jgi:hypothetical protein